MGKIVWLIRYPLAALGVFVIGFLFYSAKNEVSPVVDVVYTWVDGSDPQWQKVRLETLRSWKGSQATDGNDPCRFRDHNELKYSLRSVWKFAPFVNRIYIVTSGQRPKWIKPHPKITFIDHKDIFLNKADLPTFNSHAIESHLHRIPGLSEHFIYFNDDVFLGREAKFSHFFGPTGRIRFSFSHYPSAEGPVSIQDTGWRSGWKNTNALLDKIFRPEGRKSFAHTPLPLRKSLIKEVEKKFPYVFITDSANKFRSFTDYTLINGLVYYYAYYTLKGEKVAVTSKMMQLRADLPKIEHKLKKLQLKKYHSFCLEDESVQRAYDLRPVITAFLEEYFPEKAPWEK